MISSVCVMQIDRSSVRGLHVRRTTSWLHTAWHESLLPSKLRTKISHSIINSKKQASKQARERRAKLQQPRGGTHENQVGHRGLRLRLAPPQNRNTKAAIDHPCHSNRNSTVPRPRPGSCKARGKCAQERHCHAWHNIGKEIPLIPVLQDAY